MNNSDFMQEVEAASHISSLHQHNKRYIKWCLLALNIVFNTVGGVAGPLLLRLYFLHGGKRIWLTTLLQNTGFFVSLIPLSICYLHGRFKGTPRSKILLTPKLSMSSAGIGLLFGVVSYMYALGLSYLPLSTCTILVALQIAFVAVFARVLVKQKFSPYSINSVMLMILSGVVLGLNSSGDRPPNVSKAKYYLGFFVTIAAVALLGFVLPLVELVYAKANQAITYVLLLQFQVGVSSVATLFCVIGMLINKDFQAIPKEAKEFGLGELKYYMTLVWCAISFQFQAMGTLGVIFYATSLFNGIMGSLLVPITEAFAVAFFHEKFDGGKGVALALSIWGFISYFYGEYKKQATEKEQEANVV